MSDLMSAPRWSWAATLAGCALAIGLAAVVAPAAQASTEAETTLTLPTEGSFTYVTQEGVSGAPNTVPPTRSVVSPDTYPAPGGSNYSGSLAASYADEWALGNDTKYWPTVYADDCVDFVAQALYAGNLEYVNNGKQIADSWWNNGAGLASGSWYNAPLMYSFLEDDVPGGTYEGSAGYPAYLSEPYTPSSVVTGDVLMYNWSGGWNGNPNHLTMQVGVGSDEKNSSVYGNVVDQHSPGQKHNIWSEWPENTKLTTTTISFEHVWASNP